MEKPLPLTLMREIVRLLLPVLLSLRIFELLSPMITSPKLALVGVAARRPSAPVPLSPIVKWGSEALLVIVMLPVATPVVPGAKRAAKLMLCPAESLNGVATSLMAKPLPMRLTREMVITVCPEFTRVTVLALSPATATLPNAKLPGLATNIGIAAALVRRVIITSIRVTMKIRVNVSFLSDDL
jgi:hypothetical protein